MIKFSVFYPNEEGSTFDMDYYVTKHIPLCRQLTGDAMRRAEIDKGLGGAAPGSKPPFVAAVHMYFDSLEAFQASFVPHRMTLADDVPNYTNIRPVLQMAEVL